MENSDGRNTEDAPVGDTLDSAESPEDTPTGSILDSTGSAGDTHVRDVQETQKTLLQVTHTAQLKVPKVPA